MKSIIACCILLSCVFKTQAAGFQTREMTGPAGKPIKLAIWYPSATPPQARNTGTFIQQVASDGEVAGTGLPLVIISHGTGGSQYSHYDTALALADAGFIVVAPIHPGDNYADRSEAANILERPRHIIATLDYLLREWPQRAQIAPSRIGIFGFSSGGFTALVNIGGQPDLRKVGVHCAAHPAEYACQLVARHGDDSKQVPHAATPQMHDRRIRAAVIVAPALGFTFDNAALAKVDVPVQLWRAEDDIVLPHPWYAEHVRAALPRMPEYHVVPRAGHLDFLAPCTAQLAALVPQICVSQDGFDRGDFHKRFNADVVGFFHRSL
ncbi:putative dienelactone hydrolase [Pseudoduganella lurida]|uniref:Putative dienelactone hydrolase n=1 Tax=Pseudoduganella lurida TaxID=1036180 RepID=A0A562RBU4_9BURK|nr:dienelactone hydrolase family protein [Pseudoduganella lurida]TWI66383.1 putative dienelactone hydrolase [Pseudoduganella lurida]